MQVKEIRTERELFPIKYRKSLSVGERKNEPCTRACGDGGDSQAWIYGDENGYRPGDGLGAECSGIHEV